MTDLRVKPLKAWAVVHPDRRSAGYDARIRGGDYRCDVFWTRRKAVAASKGTACHVVRVVIVQVFP